MKLIERNGDDIKCYVTRIMLEMGMPAHLRGYHYLREAICLTSGNMELVGSITKLLYPEIAKTYQTTSIKVERAIRSVIEVGWERGNEELFEEIFGYSRVNGRVRPTNSEFILGVADMIHFECCTGIEQRDSYFSDPRQSLADWCGEKE